MYLARTALIGDTFQIELEFIFNYIQTVAEGNLFQALLLFTLLNAKSPVLHKIATQN